MRISVRRSRVVATSGYGVHSPRQPRMTDYLAVQYHRLIAKAVGIIGIDLAHSGALPRWASFNRASRPTKAGLARDQNRPSPASSSEFSALRSLPQRRWTFQAASTQSRAFPPALFLAPAYLHQGIKEVGLILNRVV